MFCFVLNIELYWNHQQADPMTLPHATVYRTHTHGRKIACWLPSEPVGQRTKRSNSHQRREKKCFPKIPEGQPHISLHNHKWLRRSSSQNGVVRDIYKDWNRALTHLTLRQRWSWEQSQMPPGSSSHPSRERLLGAPWLIFIVAFAKNHFTTYKVIF